MIQHIGEEPVSLDAEALGDYWPGIQLYYPPVKYSPGLGIYEDMEQASARMKKHAHFTNAHTLIFDLEDGCRQKEMSRDLLRKELPLLRKMNERVTIAIGAAEVRDLSSFLISVNPEITIQPIIEHPKSLKIAPELMQYKTVKHVVFGIHDFSKAMGIHITPENWIEELFYFINQLLFESRIAGKGVIGGVETLIGSSAMPDKFVEPHDVRRWLDLHGDNESRVVYKHACKEAAMGLTGKQVIHPAHIHLCKTAYTPSPTDVAQKVNILKAAIEADALLGGAIKFEGEMLDPPMFGKALQTLLRAHALRALKTSDMEFALHVLQLLPAQVVRQNWPYGVLL